MTIGADNTQFDKTARDTNRKLNEMSQNVKAFSQGITSSFVEAAKSMAGFYAVAKAGTVFQDLIEKNDQFNKSLREVSTLSDEVANNLDSYKQKILELTTQIPIGADEAAKALYQINSAGHTGAEGMAVLEASAKAAIGGVTDTATAADTITTVLNAYKMSASEAATVSDKLFTAVKLGKTTMGELGASIAQVAPVAASFGVSIDQVLGAVATLTKNGTPTVQAMTQIRAAIVALSDSLGATYFQTHTLQEGMKEIREQYPDNNKLKETLGRVEGFNAVLAMTGENASGAAEDLDKLTKSAGAAADAYSRMSGGKGNEMTRLQNNIMKELAGLNDTVSEVVTNVAKKLNEAFDSGAMEGYIETLKDLVVVYGAYKAIAISVAAVQSANATIMATADDEIYKAQVASLERVIALKDAEVDQEGKIIPAQKAELSAREQNLAALKKEAKEVAAANAQKAKEAAANLAAAKSEEAIAAAHLSTAETGIKRREEELAAAEKLGDALKIERAENELNTAVLQRNDAQKAYDAAVTKTAAAEKRANAAATLANTTATAADAAATATDTVATGFLTKSKIALTAAMAKLKAAMLSNPYGILLAVVTALAYGIYKLVQHFEKAAEAQKKFQQQIYNTTHAGEALKKNLKAIADGAAKKQSEAIADLKSKYKTLQAQWNALGNDLDKKKKFIIDNATAFHTLGFEVSSVDDAEKLLVKNTKAVVAAFEARAKAAAAQELMTEAYKKKIQAEQKVMRNTSGFRSAFQPNEKAGTINWKNLNDYEKTFLNERYKNSPSGMVKKGYFKSWIDFNLSDDAAKALEEHNRKKMQQRRKEGLKSIEDENGKTIKEYEKAMNDAAEAAVKAMEAAEVEGYKGSGGSNYNAPADTKNKAYWEAQRDAVQKQIDDLDSKASDFKEKKAKLEAEKAKYLAEIAKYDDPTKTQSKVDKKAEEQQKQLDARKELNQELLEMQAKNNDDQIALMEEGHNKRMREISNEYSKEQNEISKTALQWAKQNREAGLKGDQTKGSIQIAGAVYGGLTDEQQTALDEAIKNAQDKMEKSTQELLQSDIQYMREYLKEYGTFQQQRYAIAQEYDEKIAKLKAGGASEYEIRMAEKRKQAAIGSSKANELANGIDWSQVMTGVGTMVQSIAQATLQKIDEYRKTDEYKKLSFADKKSINDLRSQVSDRAGSDISNPFGNKVWQQIADYTKAYEDSLKNIKKANEAHEDALKDLQQAEEDYAHATTDSQKKFLQGQIDAARQRVNTTAVRVQNAQAESSEAQANLTETTEDVNQSLSDFSSNIQSLTSGSLSGFANGVVGLIKQFTGAGREAGKAGNAFGEIGGKAGGLIGAILQLIDILGSEPAKFIEDLFNKIDKVITNVLAQLPQIIMNILEGLKNVIGGIFEGIGSWFGYEGSNREEIEKANSRLEMAMSVNTEAINRLTAAMEKQNPEEAAKSYNQAVELLRINEKAEQNKMYNNAHMRDGGHSLWSDFWDNGGGNLTKEIYQALGKEYKRQGLATMVQEFSAADWNRLLKENPDLMRRLGEKISESEDDENYNGLFKDILQFASDYSEETFQELADKFQEAVTSVSFDTVYDNFVSSLMDMDKSAEDFAHDFEGYLRNAIYQAMAVEKIKPLLEGWMKGFEKAMESKESNGKYLSQKEINELMETGGTYTDEDGNVQTFMGYKAITDIGMALRDGIEELGLYNGKNDPNQEAMAKAIEGITADQADQLIGRITAIQIAVEADKSTIQGTLTQLIMISSLTTQGNAYLSDILSQHAIGNSYLEDIAKYSKAMSLELDGKMQKIVDGLNRL